MGRAQASVQRTSCMPEPCGQSTCPQIGRSRAAVGAARSTRAALRPPRGAATDPAAVATCPSGSWLGRSTRRSPRSPRPRPGTRASMSGSSPARRQLAGLRLALLDAADTEVPVMADGAVRDMSGRRFPAHLDTRYSDDGWWHGPERYSRAQPWYTFDRERTVRDWYRGRSGTPDDHQLPQPGDSTAGRGRPSGAVGSCNGRPRSCSAPSWPANCATPRRRSSAPARRRCEELDDRSGTPVHAPECRCLCDVA